MHSLPVRLLLNAITGAVVGALVIGLFALLVAGFDGVVNGIILGTVFGFVAGLSIPAYLGGMFWWQSVIFRFGQWWQKQQIGDDEDGS